MTYDAPELSIAIEQYLHWQRCGWTQHEMLKAVGRRYAPGMGGDDVIFELVMAWNHLDRGVLPRREIAALLDSPNESAFD
jgi:hypothetical protein